MSYDFTKEINSQVDPDVSKVARTFYSSYFYWNVDEGMRGDTICSFGTTFGAINKNKTKDLINLVDGRSWKRGYTKELFESDSHDVITNFRKKYHSLANFLIMPRVLNTWRAKRQFGDYYDIFLDCIRNFYLDNKQNRVEVIEKFSDRVIKGWLNSFGQKEKGWLNFIELNYLWAYVKKDTLEVKDIFSSNFQKSDAAVVGTYHKYGESLPQYSKKQTPKDCAKYFAENSLWAISRRAKDLEEKMASQNK